MIARGYTTDLYCDNPAHSGLETTLFRGESAAEYNGESWQDTAWQARTDGWYISRDRRFCLCPKCHKEMDKSQIQRLRRQIVYNEGD